MKKILLLLLLSALAWAQTPPSRKDFEKLYAKAERAAQLKFGDGLISSRSPDYELFGVDGRKVDLSLERQRFKQILSNATRVRLKSRIVSFGTFPHRVECTVQQQMQIEAYDPKSDELRTMVFRSEALDVWNREGNAWKLRQTFQKNASTGVEGRLPPEDSVWEWFPDTAPKKK